MSAIHGLAEVAAPLPVNAAGLANLACPEVAYWVCVLVFLEKRERVAYGDDNPLKQKAGIIT